MGKLINQKLIIKFESISNILSISVCCIGILTLYGWIYDITLFKSIFPNYIPMKPNTALMFIFCSISLLLQQFADYHHPTYTYIGKFLGIIISLFGIMIMSEYLLGYDLRIDQLFIPEAAGSAAIFSPGRPAPVTGLNFILIGLALILLDIKITLYFNQILSIFIGLIGLLILTSLSFHFYSSSEIVTYTYASIHTSICFILISLSLLFKTPSSGMMLLLSSKTSGGIVARRLLPIIILLPFFLGYLRMLGDNYHLYDTHTGIALYSIFITAILIIVIYSISYMLMKSDIKHLSADEKLRKSNLELEDLYNNAPCGYHSIDENGIVTHINSTELNWLGYSLNEVIGVMKITDLMTPESKRLFNDKLLKLKARGKLHDCEFDFVRKNGSTFTVLLNAAAVKNQHGHIVMYRSTIFDISERKRIERALRVSEERFHNAMDTAPIGMAIVALDGKYVEVNKALCHLVGYKKEELEKMTYQQITHPDDLAIDIANTQSLSEAQICSHQIEKRFIRKNGELIWVQLTASILRDSLTDKPLYFITQVEDITERKQIHDKIHQLAYYDSLTNLPNRRLLLDRLNQAIDLSKRHQRILGLMFLDLDKFKQVNDNLGHDVGDELLKAFAVRLNSLLRSEDTVARISGDEFVIILSEISGPRDAGVVAEKIIDIMKKNFLLLGHELQMGCSIGIAVFPNDAVSISDLMKNADIAMYTAKAAGRNQYRFYHP